jgi:hypothetical protein
MYRLGIETASGVEERSLIRPSADDPKIANTAILRAGFEPSEWWMLVDGRTYKRMVLSSNKHYLTLPLVAGPGLKQVYPNGPNDLPAIITYQNLVFVGASSIDESGKNGFQSLSESLAVNDAQKILLKMSDLRHVFKTQTTVNKSYNLLERVEYDSAADTQALRFYEHSTNSGTRWTWQTVLDDLVSLLPDAYTLVGGSVTPLDTTHFAQAPVEPEEGEGTAGGVNKDQLWRGPINLRFYGVSVWEAICQVLHATGNTICPKEDGTFLVVPCGAATNHANPKTLTEVLNGDSDRFPGSDTDAGKIAASARLLSAINRRRSYPVPEKYVVFFQRTRPQVGGSSDPKSPQEIHDKGPYSVEITTSERLIDLDSRGISLIPYASVRTGTKQPLHATGFAWWRAYESGFTNKGDTLAQELAEELVDRKLQAELGDQFSVELAMFPPYFADVDFPRIDLDFGRRPRTVFHGTHNPYQTLDDYRPAQDELVNWLVELPEARWAMVESSSSVAKYAVGTGPAVYRNRGDAEGASWQSLGTISFLNATEETIGVGKRFRVDYDYWSDIWVAAAAPASSNDAGGGGGGEDHPHFVAVAYEAADPTDPYITINSFVREYIGMDPLGAPPVVVGNPHGLKVPEGVGILCTPWNQPAILDWAPSTAYTAGDKRKADRSDIAGTLVEIYTSNSSRTSFAGTFNASEAANWTKIGAYEADAAWKAVMVEGSGDHLLIAKVTSGFVSLTSSFGVDDVSVLVGPPLAVGVTDALDNGFAPEIDDLVFLKPTGIPDEWKIVYVITASNGSDNTKVVRIKSNTMSSVSAGDDALSVATISGVGKVFKADLLTWSGTAWSVGAEVRVLLSPAKAGSTPKANHHQVLLSQFIGVRTESSVDYDLYAAGESGASGAVTPCWITTGAAKATTSGTTITCTTATVYLDTIGSSDAQRVPASAGETAYWDDPASAIQIASGKARRGYVVRTSLGTLDILWVGCKEYTWS